MKWMSTPHLPEIKKSVFFSKLIPAIAVIGEIIVNCYILWYLLISIPSDCTRLAAVTNGQQTCSIEVGAYVIVGISALLILLGIYYLVKGNLHGE
jgi:hypothetical protein